jgi:hypothetical protein
LRAFVYPEKPRNREFTVDIAAYVLYTVGCPHIPRATHYFNKERTNTMKIHFAYYNQYKNGIDIAFADNTLLFLSCAEAEKNLHTTPNSQRLIDNLAIDNPLMYAALALDCELQAWADVMDTNWNPY